MAYYLVDLHQERNAVRGLPEADRFAQARRSTKLCLVRRTAPGPFTDADVPDALVDDEAVKRFMEIEPPIAAVLPEFQAIISEIEEAYVGGLYFAAVAAACVSIERTLNTARIELHPFHTRIAGLWGKKASNDWRKNIKALHLWRYIDQDTAVELNSLYKDVRCRYLHSAPVSTLKSDALRSVRAAYRVLGTFFGFPEDLFQITTGFQCLNPQDPRFKAFYESRIVQEP